VSDYRNNISVNYNNNYNYKDPAREVESMWTVKNGSDITINTDK
jgi:hypothetical protein